MKITFEKLDKGWLVVAENGGQTERLAYEDPAAAYADVANALGIELPNAVPPPAPVPVLPRETRAPVAAAPAPETEPYEPSYDTPPPATRRNGLIQPRKSSGPPAGRSTRNL